MAAYPSPTISGTAHSFTVTADDPYGNVASSYTGTVHFTSSDTQLAHGTAATFTVTADAYGNIAIGYSGAVHFTSSATGTESGIQVTAASVESWFENGSLDTKDVGGLPDPGPRFRLTDAIFSSPGYADDSTQESAGPAGMLAAFAGAFWLVARDKHREKTARQIAKRSLTS